MELDHILLPVLALVGGFFAVSLLRQLTAKPAARQQISAALAQPVQATPRNPVRDLANDINTQVNEQVVQRWMDTHIATLVDRNTKDIAAGYAPQAAPATAAPKSPPPNS